MTRLDKLLSFYESSPYDPFLQFALAKEYEQAQDYATATAFYEKLVAENPDYVGTYYHFGKLQERLNAFDAALQTYVNGIAIAKKIGDRHAEAELAEAKMEIE